MNADELQDLEEIVGFEIGTVHFDSVHSSSFQSFSHLVFGLNYRDFGFNLCLGFRIFVTRELVEDSGTDHEGSYPTDYPPLL